MTSAVTRLLRERKTWQKSMNLFGRRVHAASELIVKPIQVREGRGISPEVARCQAERLGC